MTEYQGEGINHSFQDPTQADDIYPPPPGFDNPAHETDRYRQYNEEDVENSAKRTKPDDRTSEMNYKNKKKASITRRIWSVLKVTFICACPLFIIGLVLVILGVAKIPANYDLTKPGAPILIVAMILLIVTILLLVVYKMRSMNAYDIEEKEMTGFANNGLNSTTQSSSDEENHHESRKDSDNHGHLQESLKHNESRRI